MCIPALLFLVSESRIIHSLGSAYWSLARDSGEPIRLLETPRSLSVDILIDFITYRIFFSHFLLEGDLNDIIPFDP